MLYSFESYYKRATNPLAVPRLLRERAMYGYEISQAIKQKSGGRFTIAALYQVLYRLEEQGFAAVERAEAINNRARGSPHILSMASV